MFRTAVFIVVFFSHHKIYKYQLFYYESTFFLLTGHGGHRQLDKQYKRNCKSQGLCHMNSSCTSQIKMILDKDGKVTVNFRKTHYGHVANLAQVRLPKHEREKIAAKLVYGVPPKK